MKKIKSLSQVSGENAEATVRGDVGTLQTSFNMLKVFIGIGILATPAGFQHIGIIGGVVGMIIVAIISMYTM